MGPNDLEELVRAATAACERARGEILPRFRRVETEWKADGSPVTEADRAAERAIRELLALATPGIPVVGEELGGEPAPRHWLVDPIDGTIAFSRGIPLFGTILALMEGDEPVLGVIDVPALDERYVAWKGGGAWRGSERLACSQATGFDGAIVAHGDVECFAMAGQRPLWERMAAELGKLRGYTDVIGHVLAVAGHVDAMVDPYLNPWDSAASRVLVPEAGGRIEVIARLEDGKHGVVAGSPALVERLMEWVE